MNHAVLLVPDFALHALRRSEPALAGQPCALIAGEGKKAVLTEISPEARAVAPGDPVTLAMARCPGIVLRPRDPAAEVEAQRLLLAAAFALSPRVEATAAGWCTVDLQGADLTRLEAELHRQVRELTHLGLPARAGAAANPLLAAYAAQAADPVRLVADAAAFLRDLPLTVAGPTAAQAGILRDWGIHTLGELTTLPKGEIGRRLGPEGAALWERAAGATARPLRLATLPQSFTAAWAYEPPVETLEPLTFKLQRYAERVAAELRATGFVAERLALTLAPENGADHRREFRLPEPGADPASWLRVLLAHLETLHLESRLRRVVLTATPTRTPHKQDGLFDTGLRDPAAFWENLARLGALVGDSRVGTPMPADTHRPDAFTLTKPIERVPPPAEPSCHPEKGLVLRRFRPGHPVEVELADGHPVRLAGDFFGEIARVHGPWRTDGDWWRAERWAVEIWLVELATGGVYQLARRADAWCVEGVLD